MAVGSEKLLAVLLNVRTTVPSGLSRLTVTSGMLLLLNCTAACWPADAGKVSWPFCPRPRFRVTADPFGVMLCVMGVASLKVTVALPNVIPTV